MFPSSAGLESFFAKNRPIVLNLENWGKGSQNPKTLWISYMYDSPQPPNANAKEDLWRQIQFSATDDAGDAILTGGGGGGGVALLAFLECGE